MENKYLSENVIVVEHFCEGENASFIKEITLEDFRKIQEIIKTDIEDDLTLEHEIKIKLITPEENRKACIQGIVFAEGCSLEQARRIVDGEELLSEEQEEAQQEKEYNDLNNDSCK